MSKLAAGTDTQIIVASSAGVPTYKTLSGYILITNAGVSLPNTETVTTTNEITAAECGKTYFLSAAGGFASTLPAVSTVSTGCYFKFVVKTAPSGGSYTVITANSLENVIAGGTTDRVPSTGSFIAAGDTITFVNGQAVASDWIEFISDGSIFYMTGIANVTAGITSAQAD